MSDSLWALLGAGGFFGLVVLLQAIHRKQKSRDVGGGDGLLDADSSSSDGGGDGGGK